MTMGDAKLYVNCTGCQRDNEAGMAFCLYCGKNLPAGERRPTGTGSMCPRCGRFDELNQRFCVYCGADTNTSVRLTDPGFMSWELPRTTSEHDPNNAKINFLRSRMEPLREPAKKPPMIVTVTAIVLGAAIGFGATIMGAPIYQSAASARHPKQHLNIFAKQPFAQVTVIPFPTEEAKNFTIGQLSADGTLSIPGLAPGRYLIKVEAPGFRKQLFGVIDPIMIEANRTTLVGFPERIDLPPRHSDQDHS